MKSLFKKIFVRYFTAILIGLAIVIALISAAGMINSIRSNFGEIGLITSPAAGTVNDAVAAAVEEQYIVREYDGRIGVFIPGDTQPIQVVQVYVMYLPEPDRTLLREGIDVKGRVALNELLEDLRS